jgi:hypothetical protein
MCIIILQLLQIFENWKNCIMKIKRPLMKVVLWKETIENPLLKNGMFNDSI